MYVQGVEIVEPEFFGRLAEKCLPEVFAVVHVAADGCIPIERKQELALRTALKVDAPEAVDDMEVNDRMEELGTLMAPGARRPCHHRPGRFDDGEHLLGAFVAGAAGSDVNGVNQVHLQGS